MSARRLGIVMGAAVALLLALSGAGATTRSAARADTPTTTCCEPTTRSTELPSTTRATEPPTTDSTRPDISTEPTAVAAPSHRTTTTSRRTASTTKSTDATTVVAGATETTAAPDTTVTEPPTTNDSVQGPVALAPTTKGSKSKAPLLALLLGTLGLGAIVFAGVRARREPKSPPPPRPKTRPRHDPEYAPTLALPPLFAAAEPVVETEPAPQPDWAPIWDEPRPETNDAQAVPAESPRDRRKRERRERFHKEHDHVDPDEALAALAASAPLPEPQVVWEDKPEPAPVAEREPRRAVPDPYEDLDLSAPADLDPGIPDMDIDLSDPEP